jgi:thiol-disulfide isomerase/thioredoxin
MNIWPRRILEFKNRLRTSQAGLLAFEVWHSNRAKAQRSTPNFIRFSGRRLVPAILASAFLFTTAASAGPAAALRIGDAFPDLKEFALEGKLPPARPGGVVLVDVWASWCAPCKQSFATLNKLHQRFAPEGLVIIAVSVDEEERAMTRFLANNRAQFAVVRDAAQKLVTALDVKAMPTSFLIDHEGKVRHIHSGYDGNKTAKQYEEEIAALLRSSAPKP